MPQMMPLYWTYQLIYSNLMMLIYMILIYYYFLNNKNTFTLKKKSFTYKMWF